MHARMLNLMPKAVAYRKINNLAANIMIIAMISKARSLLLWIITHFLVVSSFFQFKSYSLSIHRKQRAYHHQRHNQLWCSLAIIFVAPSFLGLKSLTFCHAVGYSYARFVGPVSGPEHEILVHDELNGGTRVDYVARPEYQFAYGVEDSETHVLQNRKETRDGDAVKGVYSVVDPDGTLRVVKYTADDLNGFQAEVITDGVATIHGQNNDGNDGSDISANNGGNWHLQTGNAVHHNVEHDDDKDDSDNNYEADDYDGGSKNDYEVYEEQNENADSDEDEQTFNADASEEGSYYDDDAVHGDNDDGGGKEENISDNDYY